MKFKKLLFHIVAMILLMISQPVSAQGWQPLCVGGGNTTGNNSGTWQKLNSPSEGGGTWKKVGECIPPVPPVNGGRPYTHILDTTDSMGRSNCNSMGGLDDDGPLIPGTDKTSYFMMYKYGKLTPNEMDGVKIFRLNDLCGQGLVMAFGDVIIPNRINKQHFYSMTIYDAPKDITYYWKDSPNDQMGYMGCDKDDETWTTCNTYRYWRGTPRMKPWTRYYINVVY